MIIADSHEELDKVSCPSCGQHALKMTSVLYSEPLQFTAICSNCSYKEHGESSPIKVLTGEDAVRAHPHMYVGHENLEWRKIAEELIKEKD